MGLTWFDQQPSYDNNTDVYTAGKKGGLSALGQALSGVGNAFALPYGHGDPNYDQDQQKIDLAKKQSDFEFIKNAASQRLDKQKLAFEKTQQTAKDAYSAALLKSVGLDPSQYGFGLNGGASLSPSDNSSTNNYGLPQAGGNALSNVLPITQGGITPQDAMQSGVMPQPGGMSNLAGQSPQTMTLAGLGAKGPYLRQTINPLANKMDEALNTDKLNASQSTSRDIAQFNMMGQTMKGLTDLYDTAHEEGMAGDKYKSAWGQLLTNGTIPEGLANKIASPKAQAAVSGFTAARNEAIMKMQPMLSQQFGKEGTNRIMQSMMNMTNKEIGSLDQPRAAFAGAVKNTMKNLYRFTKGSTDYATRVGVDANKIMDMKPSEVDSFVRGAMSSTSLDPAEEKQLNSYLDNITSGHQIGTTASGKGFTWKERK